MRQITLKIFWSKKENDFMVTYPNSSSTGGYVLSHVIGKRLNHCFKKDDASAQLWPTETHLWDEGRYTFFEHDFIKEMAARGFDTKTLKFSIKLDPKGLKEKFPGIYADLTQEQKDKLGIE